MRWKLKVDASMLGCMLAAVATGLGPSCKNNDDIHQTAAVVGQPCFSCHTDAYNFVQTPKHAGSFPTTCNDCHSTTAWVPATGGHPEASFPIKTGAHANAAIGCTDCHIASLGPSALGQNCDCVHCHIGAHRTPSIDSAHSTVPSYPGSSASMPHNCLTSGCHPSG